MKRASIGVLLMLLGSSAIAAQDAPRIPNPGSACFDVVVQFEDVVEYRGGMEFILAPSASPSPDDVQVWDLHGPIRSDEAALWWPANADSIAAVWLRDTGILWHMSLDPVPEIMQGTAVQVLPKPEVAEVYEVRATQTECPRGGT